MVMLLIGTKQELLSSFLSAIYFRYPSLQGRVDNFSVLVVKFRIYEIFKDLILLKFLLCDINELVLKLGSLVIPKQ